MENIRRIFLKGLTVMGMAGIGAIIALTGCGSTDGSATGSGRKPEGGMEAKGSFSGDSALAHAARQLDFGPRTPGSPAHRECGEYIANRLSGYGADTVIEYNTPVKMPDGKQLPARNILGRFNSGAKSRILLLAHYDTRPTAEEDPVEANRIQPVPGANDGASGVAVLLEIARNLGLEKPAVGVDILFTDLEDSGISSEQGGDNMTWSIGAQQWVKEWPYGNDEALPRYGILLDMVGGAGAKFHKEGYSAKYAGTITERLWAAAKALGHGETFIPATGGYVMDDHVITNNAGIPTADIIENQNPSTGSFPPYWHTTGDNLEKLSPKTLAAVGQTVLYIVYTERP